MKYPTRVKDSTTTTGTGNITCANTPPLTYRALGAEVDPGDKFPYGLFHATLNEWEIGTGTMLTETTFSRAPSSSSNGDALVNFSAGTKELLCVLGGSDFANIERTTQVPFSAAIPFDVPGHAFMVDKTVSGPLTFTVAAGAVRGAMVFLNITANGTNEPDLSAFKKWGGHFYDNRNGILNQMQFFRDDSGNSWVYASQEEGALPVAPAATAVTMTGPTGGVVNIASSVFTVGTNGPRAGNVVVTPTAVTGVTFNPSSVTLPAGTSTATFTATPNTTGAKTIAVTNNGGLTNPASITYTATAAATVPATMAAPVITAGDGSISIAWVAPSDGGSAILDATFTASTGQTATGATSPTTMTVPNGTAVTVTGKARNAVGTAATASPASNSVTPAAAGGGTVKARLTQLVGLAESGTAPDYEYTGTNAAYNQTPIGGLADKAMAGDGRAIIKLIARNGSMPMLGMHGQTGLLHYGDMPINLFAHVAEYSPYGLNNATYPATSVTTGVVPADGDLMAIRKTGSVIYAEVSKDNGATWIVIYTVPNVGSVTKVQARTDGTGKFSTVYGTGLA